MAANTIAQATGAAKGKGESTGAEEGATSQEGDPGSCEEGRAAKTGTYPSHRDEELLPVPNVSCNLCIAYPSDVLAIADPQAWIIKGIHRVRPGIESPLDGRKTDAGCKQHQEGSAKSYTRQTAGQDGSESPAKDEWCCQMTIDKQHSRLGMKKVYGPLSRYVLITGTVLKYVCKSFLGRLKLYLSSLGDY